MTAWKPVRTFSSKGTKEDNQLSVKSQPPSKQPAGGGSNRNYTATTTSAKTREVTEIVELEDMGEVESIFPTHQSPTRGHQPLSEEDEESMNV